MILEKQMRMGYNLNKKISGVLHMSTIKKKNKSLTISKKSVYIIINPWKRRQIARRKAAAEALKGIWADKDDSFFTER